MAKNHNLLWKPFAHMHKHQKLLNMPAFLYGEKAGSQQPRKNQEPTVNKSILQSEKDKSQGDATPSRGDLNNISHIDNTKLSPNPDPSPEPKVAPDIDSKVPFKWNININSLKGWLNETQDRKNLSRGKSLIQKMGTAIIVIAALFQIAWELHKNNIQKSKLQEQQKQKQRYFKYYMEKTIKADFVANPFTKYNSYDVIESKLKETIANKGNYKKTLIIEGPPGIGKSTAIKRILLQRIEKRNNSPKSDSNLQVFYISMKDGQGQTIPDSRLEQKVRELHVLLHKLHSRQQDKDKNIVLIIDEINRMCLPPFDHKIKAWRQFQSQLKIIGFSSCSKATQFWINQNGKYYNERLTLPLNSPNQMFGFFKSQLRLPNDSMDDTLKCISQKYNSFRGLAILFRNNPFLKENSSLIDLGNQEAFKKKLELSLNLQTQREQINKLNIIISKICKNDQSFISVPSQKQNYLHRWLRLVCYNQLLNYLNNQWKMTRKSNKFNCITLQELAKPIQQLTENGFLMVHVDDFRSSLYEKNYTFKFAEEDFICPKSEDKRQIIIAYLTGKVKNINFAPIIRQKHETIENLRQCLQNLQYDIVEELKKNVMILDNIDQWKVYFKGDKTTAKKAEAI